MWKYLWPVAAALLVLSCGVRRDSASRDTNWQPYETRKPLKRSQIITESRYLKMDDGIEIAVDIHLPKDHQNRSYPTILRATRYLRSLELRPIFDWFSWPKKEIVTHFVANGYAWVDVDVRGSGASFGTRIGPVGPREVKDLGRIVEWIVDQPFSNGLVGATGISYNGTTSELLLVNNHPAVKAVAPRFSYFDAALDIGRPGGIQLESFTREWARLNEALDGGRVAATRESWLERIGIRGTNPVDTDRGRHKLAQAKTQHTDNWNPYWTTRYQPFPYEAWPHDPRYTSKDFAAIGFLESIRQSKAAIYSYSGWFDGTYARAAIHRFLTLPGPNHKLVIGPWNHGGGDNSSPVMQAPSNFDHYAELLRFFDHHLKGSNGTGIDSEPAIHYYTMVEERWKSTDQWPPPATEMAWYFQAEGGLATSRPPEPGFDRYRVNPETGSGDTTRWNTLLGRNNVVYPDRGKADAKLLTFTSDPLERDIEVTGHPIITLYLDSSESDGYLFVYLEDVQGEGSGAEVTYVTEGVFRILHRKISEDPPPYVQAVPYHSFLRRDALPLVPGQKAEVQFDLLPTSYRFRAGHRIRIAVAGADKDHFALFKHPWEEQPELRIHHGKDAASHIRLPVVE